MMNQMKKPLSLILCVFLCTLLPVTAQSITWSELERYKDKFENAAARRETDTGPRADRFALVLAVATAT